MPAAASATSAAALGAVREAFAPLLRDGRVELAGSIWIVTARNP